MNIKGIRIDGIEVLQKYGHYILQKDDIQMTCDSGELNESIPEFKQFYEEEKRKLQLVWRKEILNKLHIPAAVWGSR